MDPERQVSLGRSLAAAKLLGEGAKVHLLNGAVLLWQVCRLLEKMHESCEELMRRTPGVVVV
jgi:hypothetical protein